MPEAITKYAINSTLGTDAFEPLDKIVKGQRTYAASDSVLTVLSASSHTIYSSSGTVQIEGVNFTSLVNGSIRIKVDMYVPGGAYLYFYIYEENTSIASISIPSTSVTVNETKYIDIPIKKDSTYTFKASSSGNNGRISNIKLCGQVVDLSMLSYNN